MLATARWQKVLFGILFALAFATLQLFAFVQSFAMVYCENCAGRPFTWREFAAFVILVAPFVVSVAFWAAAVWYRRHRGRG
ncbi:hypothetical protein [Ramlibacter humi]|uniref:Uncharacterized protein n=1 Tax=Ramlibacter humi TaxID=2530451 RepID=A0A4Z0C8P4_9BURK|nr:hypothetical protein [Ramlibacter humi]TFZ07661.1 hypothetical protein EZ216_00395 [Ramlibacter humi]